MRDINELLRLVKKNLDTYFNKDILDTGVISDCLCFVIDDMANDIITTEEMYMLLRYIEENKINIYIAMPGDRRERIKWLNKHIRLTKNNK